MPKRRMLPPKTVAEPDSENTALKIINDDTDRKIKLDSNVKPLHFVSQVEFNQPKVLEPNIGWKTQQVAGIQRERSHHLRQNK